MKVVFRDASILGNDSNYNTFEDLGVIVPFTRFLRRDA